MQATSWCLQPVWLLVVRVAYLLYFAATLLVYQYAGRACLPLQTCQLCTIALVTWLLSYWLQTTARTVLCELIRARSRHTMALFVPVLSLYTQQVVTLHTGVILLIS